MPNAEAATNQTIVVYARPGPQADACRRRAGTAVGAGL